MQWYSLASLDILLSISSVRPRLISPVIKAPAPANLETPSQDADTLLFLRLQCLLQVVEANSIRAPSTEEDVPRFGTQIQAVLNRLEALSEQSQQVLEATKNTPGVRISWRPVRAQAHYCGVVILMHATGLVNSVPPTRGPSDPSIRWKFIADWNTRTIILSKSVLQDMGSQEGEIVPLATAPDYTFATIAFCAAILVKSQAVFLQRAPDRLEDDVECDRLVSSTVIALSGPSLSKWELPRRYARVLRMTLIRWQQLKSEYQNRGRMERSPQVAAALVAEDEHVAFPVPAPWTGADSVAGTGVDPLADWGGLGGGSGIPVPFLDSITNLANLNADYLLNGSWLATSNDLPNHSRSASGSNVGFEHGDVGFGL